ncbi:hypothetical protein TIFTF001_028043 [Ficus carica]|uniref:Uncharacterized protein n=1 Tax=Ficus carica TaxID=3494 RepID=A0AA88IZI7_FICCA|nr:hypothetical protein TIFTF001_028043 [Ficus carica]
MSEIPVFVLYDGWWEQTTKKFVGSKCKGILIRDDITYTGFLEKLFIGLEVDSTKLDIRMRIGTSMPECPLMALSNDDDIRFFICLMKKGSSCPLYASIVRKKEDKEFKFSGGSNHFSREQHVGMTPLSDSDVGGEDLEQSQEQYNSDEGLGSKEKVLSIPSELASGDEVKRNSRFR